MAHPTGLLSPIDHHHSGRMSNLGGTHSVKVWSPGDRVVFYRSWDVMVLFTLFLLVLGIGCGDFAFWVTEDEKAAPFDFFYNVGTVSFVNVDGNSGNSLLFATHRHVQLEGSNRESRDPFYPMDPSFCSN